jgi:hypothetical protein
MAAIQMESVLRPKIAGAWNLHRLTQGRIGSALGKPPITIGLAVPGAMYLPLYVAVDAGVFAPGWMRLS